VLLSLDFEGVISFLKEHINVTLTVNAQVLGVFLVESVAKVL
jgi:hypothetical protein